MNANDSNMTGNGYFHLNNMIKYIFEWHDSIVSVTPGA